MAKSGGQSTKRGSGPPPEPRREPGADGAQRTSAPSEHKTQAPELDPFSWSLAVSPDGKQVLTGRQGGAAVLADLESGAILRVLPAGIFAVYAVAFLTDGRHALTGELGSGTYLWDLETGQRFRRIGPAGADGISLALFPDARTVLLGTDKGGLLICDLDTGAEQRRMTGHTDCVQSVALLPGATRAVSGSEDGTMRLWDLVSGRELRRFDGHTDSVLTVAPLPDGRRALSGSSDETLRLWDLETGAEVRRFQTAGEVCSLALLPDGRRALAGAETTIQLWDLETGEEVRRIEGHAGAVNGIVLHPDGRHFVAADSEGGIRVWPINETAHYTTVRVALLGDSGVGKTGLGWRVAHGAYRKQDSTHGQQFWVIDRLNQVRPDGMQCETVLWDLAGQPDYRLIHALFLDHVDVGLLLFDPANRERPLSGVEYWIKHLKAATLRQAAAGVACAGDPLSSTAPMLLVAARSDRGTPTLTDAEIDAFCQRHGIAGYIRTSALNDIGIDDLLSRITATVPWHRLTPTSPPTRSSGSRTTCCG